MKSLLTTLFLLLSFQLMHAQLPDSTRSYVNACIETMRKESLYSGKLNWKVIGDSVNRQMSRAKTSLEGEEIIISVFKKLNDYHGMYGGIDTSFRSTKPGPERVLSKGLLGAYKKPRAVKTKMLDDNIAYYKMPAVLIGSDKTKMKVWSDMLTDSLCKLEALEPKAYIIDLRMNNGGNSEPMWQALKGILGEENRTWYADSRKRILPDEKDSATLAYKAAAIASRPCVFRKGIPVAVLIGPGTASSGEIMALSFTTRKNTKLFGEPSIGVANVTNGFVIQNKGYLLLTVGYIADANKKILSNFFIQPDILVKSDDNYEEPAKDVTVQAAMKWLKNKTK